MKKEFMFSEKIECWEDWGKVYHSIPAFLRGYWKGTDWEDIAEQVLDGILIHDFGGDIVKAAFPKAPAYHRVDELYEQILQYLPFWIKGTMDGVNKNRL